MKAYGRMEEWLHIFLTSALDGDECSASHPDNFTLGEKTHGTHWIGGWVGLRGSLNANVKEKKYLPLTGIKPQLSNL
jgi:hypothetical protein